MTKLTKQEAIKQLKHISKNYDTECAHSFADDVLLKLIDDEEIKEAYDSVPKWYA